MCERVVCGWAATLYHYKSKSIHCETESDPTMTRLFYYIFLCITDRDIYLAFNVETIAKRWNLMVKHWKRGWKTRLTCRQMSVCQVKNVCPFRIKRVCRRGWRFRRALFTQWKLGGCVCVLLARLLWRRYIIRIHHCVYTHKIHEIRSVRRCFVCVCVWRWDFKTTLLLSIQGHFSKYI